MPDLAQISLMFDVARRVREAGVDVISLLKRLRRQPSDPAPGDKSTRTGAYLRFQEASASVLLQVQLVATLGTPPRMAGALWTWPTVWRSMRQFSDAMGEMVAALFEIALVGDHQVLDRGIAAGEALGEAASQFPARRGGGDPPPPFAAALTRAADELAEFVAAARKDLQRG